MAPCPQRAGSADGTEQSEKSKSVGDRTRLQRAAPTGINFSPGGEVWRAARGARGPRAGGEEAQR